jgi:hypothetical protein
MSELCKEQRYGLPTVSTGESKEWVIKGSPQWGRMSMHKLREHERKAVGIKIWRAVYKVWYISDKGIEGNIYGFRVEGVEVTNGAKVTEMAEMAEMSKMVQMTTRHVIHPIAKNSEKSEMAEKSNMTARHVMPDDEPGNGKV